MNKPAIRSNFTRPRLTGAGSRISCRVAAIVLSIAAVAAPCAAADLDLVGGVLARFHDNEGTRRDRMQVAFVDEHSLDAPLPDPTRSKSSLTLRYLPRGSTEEVVIGPLSLPRNLWMTKFPGESCLYRDPSRSVAGIHRIQLYADGRGSGGLLLTAKGDAYGIHAVSGPLSWVEVSVAIDDDTFCGRFDPVSSTERRNEASEVHFVAGSGACGEPATVTTTSTTTSTTSEPDSMLRVPAEWEEQEAVWLQWPGPYEKTYEPAFAAMSIIIADHQKLHILYDSNTIRTAATQAIADAGGDPHHPRIEWHHVANDNAWMRDNGPVYVAQSGEMRIQDWGFDAWGRAFGPSVPYAADDAVPGRVGSLLGLPVDLVPIVHERGNLEFNGRDAVILNWSVIGDPVRNPGYTRARATADMKRYFGVSKVVMIEGYVPSDFTRGHVDGIARFIDPDTVVVGQCTTASVCQPGDSEASVYDSAAAVVAAAGFRVLREPFEGRARYRGGPEFNISHMNWLVGNGFVIAVGFENPITNAAAKSRLESYFPGREVYIVDMLASWNAGGGVHCHTNDQPAASTASGYRPWGS